MMVKYLDFPTKLEVDELQQISLDNHMWSLKSWDEEV